MELEGNRLKIIISMSLWGTVGLFVRWIELTSIEIAFFRALIGFVFLIVLGLVLGEEWDWEILKKNARVLIFVGLALGIHWALLFEAYKNTTISNAIISYYMAPIFIVILCRIFYGERITLKKLVSIIGAMVGLILVLKNDGGNPASQYNHIRGILFGLSAAVLYATIVTLNKHIEDMSGFKVTRVQLFISTLVILSIILFTGSFQVHTLGLGSLGLLLTVGIMHTGIAYLLYFDAIKHVEGQSIAVLSYIDPIIAIITSAIFLGEGMTGLQIFGGTLILGFALLSEL